MKIISLILLVLGLILAPGYLFYAKFSSGSSIYEFPVFSQDAERFKTGSLQAISPSNKKWNVPVILDLDPQMNPISIIAGIKYRNPHIKFSPVEYSLKYQIKLKHNDLEMWNETYSTYPKNKKGTIGGGMIYRQIILNTFSVTESGKYAFDMKQMNRSKTRVSYIDIDVRKNVIHANMKIMILGIILILLSSIGFFLSQRKS